MTICWSHPTLVFGDVILTVADLINVQLKGDFLNMDTRLRRVLAKWISTWLFAPSPSNRHEQCCPDEFKLSNMWDMKVALVQASADWCHSTGQTMDQWWDYGLSCCLRSLRDSIWLKEGSRDYSRTRWGCEESLSWPTQTGHTSTTLVSMGNRSISNHYDVPC